jgi:hypothetical protein
MVKGLRSLGAVLVAACAMAWPADNRAVPVDDPGPKATVADRADAVRKRLTDKVERVKKGVQQWAASGRDPSVIRTAMQEKVKPLLDAGKVAEGEAELDRLLEQLGPDSKHSRDESTPFRVFTNPERITIRGYDGESLDPFITRDGRYLFFNTSHFDSKRTALHYAVRVDDLTFDYQGKIGGVNLDGVLTAVSSMDRNGNFYFVSPRSYEETGATIHRGKFKDGVVTDITLMRGLRLEQPGQVNFDVEVSADGDTLYFVDSDMRGSNGSTKGPRTAHLAIAVRIADGFERLDNGAAILAAVNTAENLEFGAGISADSLELFFTRFTVKDKSFGIWRAARPRADVPFETPQRLAGIDGFVEAPCLSPDGRSLYFHKRGVDGFAIYRAARNRSLK